eukprot:TRINITY_DN2634_c0_g1_i1.p1 TRINITY_DN2634_c0_g1~~TRINITY_DN2634_c0_g1_i1.p1  ORF type:complete len:349 (+),score=68.84 TRINITY_DN2634_c0_g1_i1:92-1138(+)
MAGVNPGAVRGVIPPKKRTKRDEDEYYCDFAPVAPPVPDGAPGWVRAKDGTWSKVLYDSLDASSQTGHKSLLLYIPPGLSLPALELSVWQEVIVISGVINWMNADETVQEAVRPYSHVIRPPGLPNGPFRTDEGGPGCTMFCKWFYASNAITAGLQHPPPQPSYIPMPSGMPGPQGVPYAGAEMGMMGVPGGMMPPQYMGPMGQVGMGVDAMGQPMHDVSQMQQMHGMEGLSPEQQQQMMANAAAAHAAAQPHGMPDDGSMQQHMQHPAPEHMQQQQHHGMEGHPQPQDPAHEAHQASMQQHMPQHMQQGMQPPMPQQGMQPPMPQQGMPQGMQQGDATQAGAAPQQQ